MVFAVAQEGSYGAATLTTGWQQVGIWAVPAGTPRAVSVTPNAGIGSGQTFQFVTADGNGFQAISTVLMLFVATFGSSDGCPFRYDQPANSMFLYSYSLGWLGPVQPGGTATVDNGSCTLAGAGSGETVAA